VCQVAVACTAGLCEWDDAPDGTACTSDGIECTADVCRGGTCRHDPMSNGTPCAAGICCGAACQQCCSSSDCATPAEDCTVATCNAGACGTGPAPAGTFCGFNGSCCGVLAGFLDCCDYSFNDCYTTACGAGGCETTCRIGMCGGPIEAGLEPRRIPGSYCDACECLLEF